MKIQCPNCKERVERRDIHKAGMRCPFCKFSFESKDDDYLDEFDDLMMLDFASDGELNGLW